MSLNSAGLTALNQIALIALAQRNDPLITRINAGETLTNAESAQMATDLYKLAEIMKVSGKIIAEYEAELTAKDAAIETMSVLLGLNPEDSTAK